MPSGDVALFIATPGTLNIQPRIDGAQDTLKSHPSIKTHVVATGAAMPAELTTIQSYAEGHPSTKGMFAVDAGSTQSVGADDPEAGPEAERSRAAATTCSPATSDAAQRGYIQFTIDQQPYLQGFLPILQLYMYKVSQTLTGIADVNTGLKFLDATTVKPYVSSSRQVRGVTMDERARAPRLVGSRRP